MQCAQIREALSARLDGEQAGLPDRQVDGHLAGCGACASWAEELATLHRMVRVREAEVVPDLSARIVASYVPARSAGTRRRHRGPLGEPVSGARWALFTVALTQLVLSAPALFGRDSGATVHVAREVGSFGVALAVGLLVAAWQPARAWGLLPLGAALVLAMAGTSMLDVIDGRATALGESHHLLDVVGLAFLWLVAQASRPGGVRRPPATA